MRRSSLAMPFRAREHLHLNPRSKRPRWRQLKKKRVGIETRSHVHYALIAAQRAQPICISQSFSRLSFHTSRLTLIEISPCSSFRSSFSYPSSPSTYVRASRSLPLSLSSSPRYSMDERFKGPSASPLPSNFSSFFLLSSFIYSLSFFFSYPVSWRLT